MLEGVAHVTRDIVKGMHAALIIGYVDTNVGTHRQNIHGFHGEDR